MDSYSIKILEDANKPRTERKLYEGMTKEEMAERFYRRYTVVFGTPDRREAREYIEAKQRLLPSTKGSAPISKKLIEQLFRDKPSRVKRAERKERRERKLAEARRL